MRPRINPKQVSWYHDPFKLWLVSTAILVIGIGLALRPDRDLAQYLRYQHIPTTDTALWTRQLEVDIRHFRDKEIAFDHFKDRLLNSDAVDKETVDRIIELEMIRNKKADIEGRLNRFAAMALLPPILILEFGLAWRLARRGLRAWRNRLGPALKRSASCFFRMVLRVIP